MMMFQNLSRRLLLVSALFLLSCSSLSSTDTSTSLDDTHFAEGYRVAEMQSSLLVELSGLAASINNPGLLWGHNDSGDQARVFLFDPNSGEIRLEVRLQGIRNTDFEDMTSMQMQGKNYLLIGDIGDNSARRKHLSLYRIEEPAFEGSSLIELDNSQIESMKITYAEGPRDAETLMATPSGSLIIVSKREARNFIYKFEFKPNSMRTIASLGTIDISNITAGDIRGDGAIALRDYDRIYYWPSADIDIIKRLQRGPTAHIQTLSEPQGEALAWDGLGGLYSVPEKVFTFDQMIHYYPKK